VGLNQIEDVAADRVNKPYLPIASGAFSSPQASMLVGIACSCAILLAAVSQSVYLVATVLLSLVIGTAYSLPPFQLKRFVLLGTCCKLLVRGPVANLGIFLHASSQLGLMPQIPLRVWVLMIVVLVFSGAIALLKNLRDDKAQPVDGLAVSRGIQWVWYLLTICYSSLIIAAVFIPGINAGFLISTHLVALMYFWYLSYQLQCSPDKNDVADFSPGEFYQFIWKLFFIEYLIFPTACLLHQL
ncbi:MAG: UbiA family prenyltransferase, partial [Cyanobacteria bacterium P01_F01_bin.116]